ncbi:hypothetical protein XMM379_001907 [Aliiroseovarius sp. xm-m-379]|uniref:Pilus assembly protein n=1 Tax=Aliiroseovarius crassostreae TaxID=154981 RepID=A0A9Q9HF86_9RHOB|nr:MULTISPECIES: TadE family protein [Aliiroseovarius]NRP11991.1 hypothetical protein [Aliiroseovarius sp. xm-d-517]NRP25214.1 hypothetical protein [Aliiroseovarius sp. xm-m-379]NRP31054.1 hypothetical protein [Aliiroseovarius sp. xm-m-314]NRP34013.1 hypothetical protein [Aliiroseovarius sp. xm-a-104]NRP41515.1 hypothetical protein [Aliiroseovarius sp. xm-m-339-2]
MAWATGNIMKNFCRSERGAMTIEAVMWLPVFVVMMALVADVSFVFFRQSTILRVVQDANRAFSIGRLESAEATQAYVVSALSDLSSGASAVTTLSSGIITTTASIPVSDLTAVDAFDFLKGYHVGVTAQHFLEY